jgi:metallophosphoesterase (TIGR00282 family)
MNILAIGDVVGEAGCDFLRQHLPAVKKINSIDLTIANGENSAEGNGMTPASAQCLFDCGVDVITSGNHVFRRKEVYNFLNENPRAIRPANYPGEAPGAGVCRIDTGRMEILIVNLIGTVFIECFDSPFKTIDKILSEAGGKTAVIVDFHAEATSEKKAMGFYLDGRVSAIFGTHTHIQTADEEILPRGTAYITDIGMTGPALSVLGVDPELAIKRFMTKMPVRFQNAAGPCILSGVIFDLDNEKKMPSFIKRIQIK